MAQSQAFRKLVRAAAGMNRRAARFGAPGTVTARDLLFIESAYQSCAYCGIDLEPGHGTFDHQVPLSDGGFNRWTNIVRCCVRCNRSKFTKSAVEWTAYDGVVVACGVCGTEFRPRFSEQQRGMAKFCSRRCSALSRWRGVSA